MAGRVLIAAKEPVPAKGRGGFRSLNPADERNPGKRDKRTSPIPTKNSRDTKSVEGEGLCLSPPFRVFCISGSDECQAPLSAG
jgi:hypothetical protein